MQKPPAGAQAGFGQLPFIRLLVLNRLPLYSVFCRRLSGPPPFRPPPLPSGVRENGGSNKDRVSVLSLSSWAYFPHLPPAHVMQQINSPALPGLAWEEKKGEKKTI